MRYILGVILSVALPVFALGNLPESAATVSFIAESSIPKTESGLSGQVFSLNSNESLSVRLLDYAWLNRENVENQKLIAEYLLHRPAIPKDYETAWKTARLIYFIGNYGYGEAKYVDSDDGAQLFNYGVKGAKLAIDINPNGAEGYYWYSSCLHAYGQAKSVLATAAGANDSMPALRKVMMLQASYEGYGASRLLGAYYQDIPVLFGGNEEKSLELIKSAVDNAPQFRNNWVALGHYYYHFGYYESAVQVCKKALTIPDYAGKYEDIRYTREAKECMDKAKMAGN